MKVAIILGNRMKDDGSISDIMKKRLDLTIDLYHSETPDYIIVSGGIANVKAGVSEAKKMKEYLIEKHIPEPVIIEENQSLTTYQNALYSVPIALKLKADTIIICSSIEHFTKQSYNVVELFKSVLNDKHIKVMIYTES